MQIISPKSQTFSWVITRSSRPAVFFKREFHKIDRKSPVLESLLNKVAVLHPATLFKKETPAQTFSYEFLTPPGACFVFHYSHYAFLSVGFFNKTSLMKIFGYIFAISKRTRMKNKLNEDMILVANLVPSFRYKRKATFF